MLYKHLYGVFVEYVSEPSGRSACISVGENATRLSYNEYSSFQIVDTQ
jgi:hypothetical protein